MMEILNVGIYTILTLSLFGFVLVGLWREKLPYAVMLGLMLLLMASIAEMSISYAALVTGSRPRLLTDHYADVRALFGVGLLFLVSRSLISEIKKRLGMDPPEHSEVASFNETQKIRIQKQQSKAA